MAATAPPVSIQMDRLVGDPVKNLETSEAGAFNAFRPKIISMIPTVRTAMARGLFIFR